MTVEDYKRHYRQKNIDALINDLGILLDEKLLSHNIYELLERITALYEALRAQINKKLTMDEQKCACQFLEITKGYIECAVLPAYTEHLFYLSTR